MAGAIIENLSGRKLAYLIFFLMLCQLLCFLLGGLIAPAPTSVITVLRRICLDKNYNESKWYWNRGKGACHIVNDIKSPEITSKRDIDGNNLIFSFQIPLPKENVELDYSRWQQNMIAMLMVDIPVNKEGDHGEEYPDAILTIDARLAYRNKHDQYYDYKKLADSVEDRRLSCSLPKGEDRKHANLYSCLPIPLFELGSVHYDYYLLNLRFPNSLSNRFEELNKFDIEVDDIHVIFINQNGGFTKVWLSLKTVFFPFIIGIMVWFWRRILNLSRPAALLEYMLMYLGIALTLLNVPLEFFTLFYDCPWMTLVGDVRQGLFYAALLSFWLIFAGEHLMDDTERNRLHVYWRHLSAVLTGCLCLFIFDMCERGVQLQNPFYSIWVTEIGTNISLTFIIIAGICAGLYFCFLSYMIYKVFLNISTKQKSLPAMASFRRLKYKGIIYRFKALMLATLLCAAVTVIAFIMGQVSEGQRYEEGHHIQYSSAFLTGVYGMWNIYTFALICLYAPSHKKWPKDVGAPIDMATKRKQRKTEDENREFRVEWIENFAFIRNLNGRPTCLICKEKFAHNKKSNLERHFTSKHASFSTKYPAGDARKKAVEELQKSHDSSTSVFNNWMQSSSNVNMASFVVSQEIAKRGKPYTDGEYIKRCFIDASEELFRDFKNRADILKKIKELPLSAKKMKDRTIKMCSNITLQQIEDLKLVSALSIAVDESCDINDTAQVSLFVRFISHLGPKEELLGLLPLKGQTRGEDIANAVVECMDKYHIPLEKIVSISTDGAKSMTGVRKGFVAILKEKINHEILAYHCIIHQEALCVQTLPEEINKVMGLVITIINSIVAKALNHRQFKEFLVELESEYADLLLHNKVRWLSRENVLKRFASLLPEIEVFLLEKGIHYPELTDNQWIQNFHFMVDVTSHLNQLNRKLQGKGNTIFSMLEEVISFENKLSLFAEDFERETLFHFPSLLKHRQENNTSIDKHHFKTTILNMRESFISRFQEFKNSRATLAFVKNPLNATITEMKFSPFGIDIGNFEIQLQDLKSKEIWSSKFQCLCIDLEILEKNKCDLSSQHKWSALKDLEKEDMIIFRVWNSIPDSYYQLKKLAFAVLSLFGSTYSCEQSFSSMNFIKSKLRSRLIDENLESCLKLKTTTYKPNLLKLSKEMQGHCSH